MINAQNLGEKLIHTFNFMYEVNNDYYALGRDYFRPCTDMELEVYKGFREALEGGNEDWIIDQYKRVRKYMSDCQPRSRDQEKAYAQEHMPLFFLLSIQ